MITTICAVSSCQAQSDSGHRVIPGAYQLEKYTDHLRGQRVGVVVNHTSFVGDTHLVDLLDSIGIDIRFIFAPEHGFLGTAYNGEKVADGVYLDRIPIRSLYGSSKKPVAKDMQELDVILFDIQDVGARFYTYISTLHYVMEAAAEHDVEVIILDRPNPNGHYIDGPVLDPEYTSFVGMHPVPVVYGMTIGEYGRMINGENWLFQGKKAALTVVPIRGYDHQTLYSLPIAPSPNLPNDLSIALYPSLCFFEGTSVSAGRGTDMQFQVYGHPDFSDRGFSYTPRSMSSSKYPKHQDRLCHGVDLRTRTVEQLRGQGRLDLSHLLRAYSELALRDDNFFLKSGFIHKLAGTDRLQHQIESGLTEEEIRASWQAELAKFRTVRSKYLLYP